MSQATAPQAEMAPPGTRSVLGSLIGERKFLAIILVLLVAALGLNVTVRTLQLHFKKEVVPMRASFGDVMPRVIDGKWVQVGKRDAVETDILQALGTDEYLFCYYIDAEALQRRPEAIQRDVDGKTPKQLEEIIAGYRRIAPSAVVNLSLTYYTGKADTVAHVPERCYVAGGYEPQDPQTETWSYSGKPLGVRHISFMNQSSISRSETCHVAYFFNTNGAYEPNSLVVRSTLQDLFARYGYYAKVELMCVSPEREKSRDAMEGFLNAALPEVEKALPDWNQYKAAKG